MKKAKFSTTRLANALFASVIMLFLAGVFLPDRATAQVQVVWDKTLGGSGQDRAMQAVATPDGGYIAAGISRSPADGDKTGGAQGGTDYWVVKTDASGNKQWDRTFGGGLLDEVRDLLVTPDGGYLVAGWSESGTGPGKTDPGNGAWDYWLIKLDANGNREWDRCYGGDNREQLLNCIPVSQGGFLLAGHSLSSANGDKSQNSRGGDDYWIVRIDDAGSILWEKTYGGAGTDYVTNALELDNGDFFITGFSTSGVSGEKSNASNGSEDYWLLRIDANGNLLWDQSYGGGAYDDLSGVIRVNPNFFVLYGQTTSGAGGDKSDPGRGDNDIWLVAVDANGNKIWDKTYGGAGLDRGVVLVPNNAGLLFACYSDSEPGGEKSEPSRGGRDYWVVQTDFNGNKLWDKTIGGGGVEHLVNFIALGNNEYMLCGSSSSNTGFEKSEDSRGGDDFWLVKIRDVSSQTGITAVSPETAQAPGLITLFVYGNPFDANSEIYLYRKDGSKTLAPIRYEMLSQYQARAVFELEAGDLGDWSLRVAFNDQLTDTLEDALEAEEAQPFLPCVQINGRDLVGANRWTDYFVTVSNNSGADQTGVPLWIVHPGDSAEVKVSYQVAGADPLNNAWQDLNINWPFLPETVDAEDRVFPLFLPYLPANATVTIRLRVRAELGLENFELKAWTNSLLSGDAFDHLGAGCLYVALAAVGAEAIPEVLTEVGPLETWRVCAAQAATDLRRDLQLLGLDWYKQPETTVMTQQQFYFAAALRVFECMNYDLDNQQKARLIDAVKGMLNYGNLVAKAAPTEFTRCAMTGLHIDAGNFPCFQRELLINHNARNDIDADRDSTVSESEAETMRDLSEPCLHASYLFSPVCMSELVVRVVASYDPNEKVGVMGEGANGYLPQLQPFKYAIHFENLESATAPALEVFVYDTLDAEVFDLSTFRFGPVGFGDTLVYPLVYPDSMFVDVDMRPDRPYIVRVTGEYDRAEGAAKWSFVTLDPQTMELVENPFDGFLPPNHTSPEGQGFVFLTVEPKHDLPSGARLSNDAKIVFDLNPPIYTEPWVNTLDQDLPQSAATAELAPDSTILLNWSGSDRTSGVKHYTIYMSVDGNPYVPVRWQTSELEARVGAEAGHVYRFYSIATDGVDNRELVPALPDAVINLDPTSTPEALDADFAALARPNPFSGQTTFAINLTKPAKLTLEVRDLSGRLVAAETFEAPEGQSARQFDASDLSAGAYFYTLRAQDGRKAEGKLIVK